MMAAELELEYSFFFRLMSGERRLGGKAWLQLMKFCDKNGFHWTELVIDLEEKSKETPLKKGEC